MTSLIFNLAKTYILKLAFAVVIGMSELMKYVSRINHILQLNSVIITTWSIILWEIWTLYHMMFLTMKYFSVISINKKKRISRWAQYVQKRGCKRELKCYNDITMKEVPVRHLTYEYFREIRFQSASYFCERKMVNKMTECYANNYYCSNAYAVNALFLLCALFQNFLNNCAGRLRCWLRGKSV